MKAFQTWRSKGKQYLAIGNINTDGDVLILDEEGGNFGGWRSVDEFRKRQRKNNPNQHLPLPDCEVALRFRVIAGVEYRELCCSRQQDVKPMRL